MCPFELRNRPNIFSGGARARMVGYYRIMSLVLLDSLLCSDLISNTSLNVYKESNKFVIRYATTDPGNILSSSLVDPQS